MNRSFISKRNDNVDTSRFLTISIADPLYGNRAVAMLDPFGGAWGGGGARPYFLKVR